MMCSSNRAWVSLLCIGQPQRTDHPRSGLGEQPTYQPERHEHDVSAHLLKTLNRKTFEMRLPIAIRTTACTRREPHKPVRRRDLPSWQQARTAWETTVARHSLIGAAVG